MADFKVLSFFFLTVRDKWNVLLYAVCWALLDRLQFVTPIILPALVLYRNRAASSLSCHSSDWDQPYYNDWENSPLQQKYHPRGLAWPHSYNRVHIFVFINPIRFSFVRFSTEQLHSYAVGEDIKGPDIARGCRIDAVNENASCC